MRNRLAALPRVGLSQKPTKRWRRLGSASLTLPPAALLEHHLGWSIAELRLERELRAHERQAALLRAAAEVAEVSLAEQPAILLAPEPALDLGHARVAETAPRRRA